MRAIPPGSDAEPETTNAPVTVEPSVGAPMTTSGGEESFTGFLPFPSGGAALAAVANRSSMHIVPVNRVRVEDTGTSRNRGVPQRLADGVEVLYRQSSTRPHPSPEGVRNPSTPRLALGQRQRSHGEPAVRSRPCRTTSSQ